MDAAVRMVAGHMLAIERKGGRLLSPLELRQALDVVKAMSTATKRTKPPKGEVAGRSAKDLLGEAMKFPEVREALAALGGGV